MINLNNIKIILQTAGISQLKISFDGEFQIIDAEYVFRGKPGHKKITYQEVIDSLNIGLPETSVKRLPIGYNCPR